MSGGSWVQSPVWPSFLFNRFLYCTAVFFLGVIYNLYVWPDLPSMYTMACPKYKMQAVQAWSDFKARSYSRNKSLLRISVWFVLY